MFTEFLNEKIMGTTAKTSEVELFIKWLCANNWGYEEEELLDLYRDFLVDTNAKEE